MVQNKNTQNQNFKLQPKTLKPHKIFHRKNPSNSTPNIVKLHRNNLKPSKMETKPYLWLVCVSVCTLYSYYEIENCGNCCCSCRKLSRRPRLEALDRRREERLWVLLCVSWRTQGWGSEEGRKVRLFFVAVSYFPFGFLGQSQCFKMWSSTTLTILFKSDLSSRLDLHFGLVFFFFFEFFGTSSN